MSKSQETTNPTTPETTPSLEELMTTIVSRSIELLGQPPSGKDTRQMANTVFEGHRPLSYFLPEELSPLPLRRTGTDAPIDKLGELPCVQAVTKRYPWATPVLHISREPFYQHNFADNIRVAYYRSAKDRLMGSPEVLTLASWCHRRKVDPKVLEEEFFEANRDTFTEHLCCGEEMEEAMLADGNMIFAAYTEYVPTGCDTYPGLKGSCMSDPDLGTSEYHPVMAYGGNSPSPTKLWVLRTDETKGTVARAIVHGKGYVRLYFGGKTMMDTLFIRYEAKRLLAKRGIEYDKCCLEGATLTRLQSDEDSLEIVAPYLDGNYKKVAEHMDYLEVVPNCSAKYDLYLEDHLSGRYTTTLVKCECCGEQTGTSTATRVSGTHDYYCDACAETEVFKCGWCCDWHRTSLDHHEYKGELYCNYGLGAKGLAVCDRCDTICNRDSRTKALDYRTYGDKQVCRACAKTRVMCQDCGCDYVANVGETREELQTAMYIDDGTRFGLFSCRACIQENTGIVLPIPQPRLSALTALEQMNEETKENTNEN